MSYINIENLSLISKLTLLYYFSIATVLIIYIFQYFFGWFDFLKKYKSYLEYGFVLYLILLVGFRPIGGEMGAADSQMYLNWLNNVRNGQLETKDLGFSVILFVSSFFKDRFFFVLCSALTFLFIFLASKKMNEKLLFLFFLSYISTLYFWNHVVFSIRQGLGGAIFIYALFCDRKYIKYFFLILAVLIHKSYLLPFLAVFVSIIYNKPIKYLAYLWCLVVVMSYFFSDTIIIYIGKFIEIFDKRSVYFLFNDKNDIFYSKYGFRIDMILYSLLFIFFIIYYILKKNVNEQYLEIAKIFIIINMAFILIIKVNHSYRFAYLSWFLSPILVYYPFIKNKVKVDKNFLILFSIFLITVISYNFVKIF